MTEQPSSHLCSTVVSPCSHTNSSTFEAIAQATDRASCRSPAAVSNENLSESKKSAVAPSSQLKGTNNCIPQLVHPSLAPFTTSSGGPAAGAAIAASRDEITSPVMHAKVAKGQTKKKRANVPGDGVASYAGSLTKATVMASAGKKTSSSAVQSPSKNKALSPASLKINAYVGSLLKVG